MKLRCDSGYKRVAKRLARMVADTLPEVGPVYVLADHLLSHGWQCQYGVRGYIRPTLAHEMRDYIAPWRGSGSMMVLALRFMADLARIRARRGAPDANERFAQMAVSTCIHELAHIAVTDEPHYLENLGTADVVPPATHFAVSYGPNRTREALIETKWSHDNRFFRAAMHLAFRAAIDAGDVVGDAFRPGDFAEYEAAMGDEPHRLAHLPVMQILQTPMPPALVERFGHDMATWQRGLSVSGRESA